MLSKSFLKMSQKVESHNFVAPDDLDFFEFGKTRWKATYDGRQPLMEDDLPTRLKLKLSLAILHMLHGFLFIPDFLLIT